MPRYVALLRAVNLGSRNVVRMEDLRRDLEKAGFGDVTTYLNSGNAVFTAAESETAVRKEAERIVSGRLGKPATVLVRSSKNMAAIVAKNPFEGCKAPPARQSVTFLPSAPTGVPLGRWAKGDFDVLALGRREIFSVGFGPPGRGGAPVTLLPERLASQATTRTWNGVRALAERACSRP